MAKKTAPQAAPAVKAPDRGEAYAGVADTLTMGGVAYHLTFNNMTFVHIENIYRERYKRTVGLPQVFAELQAISYAAMMAVFYAAMMEGGNETIPTWEKFARDFSLTDLPTVSDALLAMAGRSLPEPEGNEKKRIDPAGEADDGWPWAGLIYKALDLGLTLADYWRMTPRGVVALVRERAQDEACARAEAGQAPAASGGYEKNGSRYMRVGRIPR